MEFLSISFLRKWVKEVAYKDDLCKYGDQWRNGRLLNPQQAGDGYVADVEIAVNSRDFIPEDAEVITHIKKYSTYLCYKVVVITKQRYDELMSGQK